MVKLILFVITATSIIGFMVCVCIFNMKSEDVKQDNTDYILDE
jgi:hypothetical protein